MTTHIDLDQFEELALALREADETHADAWADWKRAQKIMNDAASAQTAARTALRAYVEQCAGARINSI